MASIFPVIGLCYSSIIYGPWSREFYQHVIELNLMNGDSVKAREIQIEKGLLLDKQ